MSWRIVRAIAHKDILDAIKNLYILFGLILPVGISLLLGAIFPEEGELLKLTVAVHDPGSSRLVANLRALPDVEVVDVAAAGELSAATATATGGLDVPAGFDAAVAAGEQPEMPVYLNRRRGGGELAAFQLLIQQQIWDLAGQDVLARLTWNDVGSPFLAQGASAFRFDHYLLVMVLVMALSMAGTFVVPTLLVEEKEKRTLDALLLSPARPSEVVAGKALTGLLYGLLTAGILIALNHGWEGAWPVTLLALLLGTTFVVAVGLLMGALFKTTNQVNTWSTVVMLLLMAPSWTGIMTSPPALDLIFRLIPTQYLSRALQLALGGDDALRQAGPDLAILAGCTLVTLAAVAWVLRRERS